MRVNQHDIVKMVKDKMGKTLSLPNLWSYAVRPHWQPMIDKFREEFEAKISDEDLASKRRRVQELSKLFERMKPDLKMAPKAAQMLSLIREEMEGNSSGPNVFNQYNQFNGLSDEDLRKVIDENSRFLQIAEKRKKELTIEVDSGEGSEGSATN